MAVNTKLWFRFSLFNLMIVAFLGLLMRYKIGFEFPYLDQKNLQHAHSHFAFTGWVGHTLMVLMVWLLRDSPGINIKKYNKIITLNLIASYGMAIFFVIQGYGVFSIIFSTLSMLVSFLFAYHFILDLKQGKMNALVKNWLKAGTVFSVISSAGTLVLVYLMASHTFSEKLYLASIYFYLHFQYNGWFFFVCMGLFCAFAKLEIHQPFFRTVFLIFTISCVPAYLLSTLWLDLPMWMYWLCVLSAIAQVFAWFWFVSLLIRSRNPFIAQLPLLLRRLLIFIGIAVSIKLLLQLGSTIPQMSQLAFGFRPIVIAYLHLVLLAIISLFLLFYLYSTGLFPMKKSVKTGLVVFSIGVIINEMILALQGAASLDYIPIPFVNEMLFAAAIILVSGISIMAISSLKKSNPI